jgi:hypothetical protein
MEIGNQVQVQFGEKGNWVKGGITDMATERGQTIAKVEFDEVQTLRQHGELLAAPSWWFDVLDLCLIL